MAKIIKIYDGDPSYKLVQTVFGNYMWYSFHPNKPDEYIEASKVFKSLDVAETDIKMKRLAQKMMNGNLFS